MISAVAVGVEVIAVVGELVVGVVPVGVVPVGVVPVGAAAVEGVVMISGDLSAKRCQLRKG